MKVRLVLAVASGLVIADAFACAGYAEQGVAEKVGQKLDDVGRGLRREATTISDAVRKRFDVVRTEVGKMGVHSRVYSRLHWDRALNGSKIEVHMLRDGGVLLRGTVPDEAAKARAAALASDTVDVSQVIDELVPLTTAAGTPPPGTGSLRAK